MEFPSIPPRNRFGRGLGRLDGPGRPAWDRYPLDGGIAPCDSVVMENTMKISKAAVRVETIEYRKSHGKEPKGRGSWAFAFGDADATPWFTKSMPYAAARDAAVRYAQSIGCTTVYALP